MKKNVVSHKGMQRLICKTLKDDDVLQQKGMQRLLDETLKDDDVLQQKGMQRLLCKNFKDASIAGDTDVESYIGDLNEYRDEKERNSVWTKNRKKGARHCGGNSLVVNCNQAEEEEALMAPQGLFGCQTGSISDLMWKADEVIVDHAMGAIFDVKDMSELKEKTDKAVANHAMQALFDNEETRREEDGNTDDDNYNDTASVLQSLTHLWKDDPKKIAEALSDITTMCSYDGKRGDRCRNDFGRLGGPTAIIKLMGKHRSNSNIQVAAFLAIMQMCYQNQFNIDVTTEVGGVDAVIKTMLCFPNDSFLQMCGVYNLRKLVYENKNNNDISFVAEGVSVILSAMKRHATNSSLQHHGAYCIHKLARNGGEMQRVLSNTKEADNGTKSIKSVLL